MIDKTKILKAQKYAFAKDGLCLSTEYIGVRDKLEWKCSNKDHPSWFAAYDTVINRKTWCSNCANDKNFEKWRTEGLNRAHEYAKTRGGTCLSTQFLKGSEKLEWKCANPNHPSWFAGYHKITSVKSWCAKCIVSTSEFKVNNILNYLFDTKFLKTRTLDWNINPKTNKNLELDGYCDNLKIAFEFQGEHHTELAFNNTQIDLDEIQYKDQLKKQNCLNNNIQLIIINDIRKKKFETFYQEIIRGIEAAGIKINENRNNNIVKLKELYNFFYYNTYSQRIFMDLHIPNWLLSTIGAAILSTPFALYSFFAYGSSSLPNRGIYCEAKSNQLFSFVLFIFAACYFQYRYISIGLFILGIIILIDSQYQLFKYKKFEKNKLQEMSDLKTE
jgi:hypothetical protein